MMLMSAAGRCEGTVALKKPMGKRALTGMEPIAGRSSGGRPLRRRREMVLMSAAGRCEGPVALKPPVGEPRANRNGRRLLFDSVQLQGVRSVGAVNGVDVGCRSLRGDRSPQETCGGN